MPVVAAVAGLLIGLSLGTLGGGGSVLAVPALVYLLGMGPVAATTGSLVVVGVSALAGAVPAYRRGNVRLGRGLAFGLVGTGGAALGAVGSTRVDEDILLVSFAALMLVVAAVMLVKQLRGASVEGGRGGADDPIIRVSPTFMCNCPQALRFAVTALVVGALTGFLGVGGGFLVVPALVLALSLPMPVAAGTSLLVIAVTSAAALVVRVGSGVSLDWPPVLLLTAAAMLGSLAGARVADRLPAHTLSLAFAVLLLAVAGYTGAESLPSLL